MTNPGIRQKILEAHILILGTPIWMGQPGSIAKRVLERIDAFFEEIDDEGRMVSYGRVAAVAVVGNKDGAHHVSPELYQGLNDGGFTLAPMRSPTGWARPWIVRTLSIFPKCPTPSRRRSTCSPGTPYTSRN